MQTRLTAEKKRMMKIVDVQPRVIRGLKPMIVQFVRYWTTTNTAPNMQKPASLTPIDMMN